MEKVNNKLAAEAEQTGTSLCNLIAGFSEPQLNTVPFEGSWTGGQVAEHLILGGGILQVIHGRTVDAARAPDEKLASIAKVFLDRTVKLKSPDFIVPRAGYYRKEEVLKKLQTIWTNLEEAAQTQELSAVCLDFDLPGFGQLTRLEWIYFYIFHTQRHIGQLQDILAALRVPA